MSTRMGMADGRCFTIHTSAQLYNDYVMTKNGIKYEDNYSYRKLLQSKGPALLTELQAPSQTSKNGCATCDAPLMSVPNIY
jgi:hypothetical protein